MQVAKRFPSVAFGYKRMDSPKINPQSSKMAREAQSQSAVTHDQPTPVPANMATSRGEDEVEMNSFDQVLTHEGHQELKRKKVRVLAASSLLQLPIWGMQAIVARSTTQLTYW